jgi:hypothetical protein
MSKNLKEMKDGKPKEEYVINVYDKDTYECITYLITMDKTITENKNIENICGLHKLTDILNLYNHSERDNDRLNKIKLFIESGDNLDQIEKSAIDNLIKLLPTKNIILYCRNNLLNISNSYDVLKVYYDNSNGKLVYDNGLTEFSNDYDLSIPKLKRESLSDYL